MESLQNISIALQQNSIEEHFQMTELVEEGEQNKMAPYSSGSPKDPVVAWSVETKQANLRPEGRLVQVPGPVGL